ncbi:hypothetical protein D3C77_466610 [compost metagenome]
MLVISHEYDIIGILPYGLIIEGRCPVRTKLRRHVDRQNCACLMHLLAKLFDEAGEV